MALPLMNVGGLASGLDTNSIIDQLVQVERIPINQLQSRKVTYQAKDNAWQTVTTRYSAIRTALDAIKYESDLAELSSAVSSSESVATASVTGAPAPGAMTFTVDQLADAHQVISATDFSAGTDLVGAGDFTVTIDGQDHVATADAATTLDDLAASINALDVGVTASVLQVDDTTTKLFIAADNTGTASAFTTSATIASLTTTDVLEQASDAQLTIGTGPGAITITRSSNTIGDLYQGVSIDLVATSASPVTISVTHDTEATTAAITTLVDELNAALTTMANYTDYNADAEQGGALLGDSTARSLITSLRTAVSGTVMTGATYPIASNIGISLNRDGTFDLDATKLSDALETDQGAVVEFLTGTGGLFENLDTTVDVAEGSGGSIARARDRWQSQIGLIDDRIEVMEDRVERREAELIRQFAALEVALASLQTQGEWLTAQLASLDGSQ